MKICLHCAARFNGPLWQCPSCGFAPPTIDGCTVHAPRLAEASASGFSRDEFELLFSLESHNFWFRGRNELIIAALRQYCADARSILEIGCGTGFVLHGIGKAIPSLELFGSEIALAGLAFAKSRNPRATLFQMDAVQIPYDEEFDVIGAFDVLEHIEDDAAAVAEIFKALKPAGQAIISVPQHMFLWGDQDRHARHFRRYGVRQLERELERAGFAIEMKSAFVTMLLPALYFARRMMRGTAAGASSAELHLPASIDRVFGWTIALERRMIEHGVRFPVGGSQLVVARKPD